LAARACFTTSRAYRAGTRPDTYAVLIRPNIVHNVHKVNSALKEFSSLPPSRRNFPAKLANLKKGSNHNFSLFGLFVCG
jgi:hypothetical protein